MRLFRSPRALLATVLARIVLLWIVGRPNDVGKVLLFAALFGLLDVAAVMVVAPAVWKAILGDRPPTAGRVLLALALSIGVGNRQVLLTGAGQFAASSRGAG